MRSFHTPIGVTLATLLALTSLVQAATDPVAPAGTAAATPSTDSVPVVPPVPVTDMEVGGGISVDRIDFTKYYKDPNGANPWMVIQVDFSAKSNPEVGTVNPKWVEGVEVTLTLAWGTKGPPAEIDLAMADTVKLLGIEVNRPNTVYFFVPPEILQQGYKRIAPRAIDANAAPTFYVVQFKAGSLPIEHKATNLSAISLPNRAAVEGFLKAAADKTSKNAGWLMSGNDVPATVYWNVVLRNPAVQNIPTIVPNADSGR